jgi:monoamine oxidase
MKIGGPLFIVLFVLAGLHAGGRVLSATGGVERLGCGSAATPRQPASLALRRQRALTRRDKRNRTFVARSGKPEQCNASMVGCRNII